MSVAGSFLAEKRQSIDEVILNRDDRRNIGAVTDCEKEVPGRNRPEADFRGGRHGVSDFSIDSGGGVLFSLYPS